MRALSVGTKKGLMVPVGANLKTSNDSTYIDLLGMGRSNDFYCHSQFPPFTRPVGQDGSQEWPKGTEGSTQALGHRIRDSHSKFCSLSCVELHKGPKRGQPRNWIHVAFTLASGVTWLWQEVNLDHGGWNAHTKRNILWVQAWGVLGGGRGVCAHFVRIEKIITGPLHSSWAWVKGGENQWNYHKSKG